MSEEIIVNCLCCEGQIIVPKQRKRIDKFAAKFIDADELGETIICPHCESINEISLVEALGIEEKTPPQPRKRGVWVNPYYTNSGWASWPVGRDTCGRSCDPSPPS
jgi:hypothetical protein